MKFSSQMQILKTVVHETLDYFEHFEYYEGDVEVIGCIYRDHYLNMTIQLMVMGTSQLFTIDFDKSRTNLSSPSNELHHVFFNLDATNNVKANVQQFSPYLNRVGTYTYDYHEFLEQDISDESFEGFEIHDEVLEQLLDQCIKSLEKFIHTLIQ